MHLPLWFWICGLKKTEILLLFTELLRIATRSGIAYKKVLIYTRVRKQPGENQVHPPVCAKIPIGRSSARFPLRTESSLLPWGGRSKVGHFITRRLIIIVRSDVLLVVSIQGSRFSSPWQYGTNLIYVLREDIQILEDDCYGPSKSFLCHVGHFWSLQRLLLLKGMFLSPGRPVAIF